MNNVPEGITQDRREDRLKIQAREEEQEAVPFEWGLVDRDRGGRHVGAVCVPSQTMPTGVSGCFVFGW